jgi:hypothetical protein
MRDNNTREENITAPKQAFDDLLGKLLKSPPLPKATIPPKKARTPNRRQSSERTGGEK